MSSVTEPIDSERMNAIAPVHPSLVIPSDTTFRAGMARGLVWVAEIGMGYSGQAIRSPSIYDAEYWANYEERARSPIAQALNDGRVSTVNRYVGARGVVVDIGIGCGTFILARSRNTYGYDVNPLGVAWLREHGCWHDPYRAPAEHVTLWDALEHIHEPAALLRNVQGYAFVSIPIFSGAADVLRSKHYKPEEHIWYWTRDGLIRWMAAEGFECVEHGTPESLLGRESIHSFVFRRGGPHA